MKSPALLWLLLLAGLATGPGVPAAGPDSGTSKPNLPESSSVGPPPESPPAPDQEGQDLSKTQQPLPPPEEPGLPSKKQSLPQDTSAAAKALEEKNRALFEQLFGDTPKEKKLISKDMASKGTAIYNQHRSHKAIHDVAYCHIEAIKLCYQRRLEVNPDLRGEMLITFVIRWSGKVQDIEVVKTNIGDAKLQSCVISRIKGWKFTPIPQAEGDVSVAYPIRFFP